jgi:putative inorganic carbon (HCO3(-)) transporter
VIALGLAFLSLGLLGTKWVVKVPWLGAPTAGLPGELAWLPEGETTFNPNVIGGALLWVLPMSLSMLFWALQRAERRWGWAAAQGAVTALSLGLLLLTQSRGAWMGFAISLLILLTFAGGRVGRIGTALIVTALLVLVAVNPVTRRAIHLGAEFASAPPTATLRQRLELWSHAQYAIADFPYTGIGLDAFEHMTRLMYPLFYGSSIPHPHAHNEFLDVAVDLGVPGLIAWQALYIVTLWMLWHAYRRSPDGLSKALALGSGGALIAHLVHGMVSVAVLVAKPNIVFWIIVGLSAALYRTAGWPGSDTGSS